MNFLYVLLAVFAFGVMIFLHECGHFLTARLFGVTVKEFSIGMGPRLLSYTSKKTGIVYKICALPIGGYVSMEGEDEESSDPNSLGKKPAWQRLIIMAAGGVVNLLFGFLVMLLCVSLVAGTALTTPTVGSFPALEEGRVAPSYEAGLREGDRIVSVDGRRVRIGAELDYEIMRRGIAPVTLVVERGGERLVFENFSFPTFEESGETLGGRDFYLATEKGSVGAVLRHTLCRSTMTVRMVWESIFDLLTGRFGIEAVSGPVGVAGAMVETAKTGVENFLYLVAVISLNLGVVNLFPLPALDGGRILLLLVSAVIRRPIPEKIEGAIHLVGLILLFGLMIFITGKDIVQLFIG
ncbi:MAG: site-2 protease family protein [Clostridia bacterium]|nr:site-2 protease family protein [Clostridia bacterium]